MEIIAIVYILYFCWINFFFQCPKIIFIILSLGFCCKSILNWMIKTLLVVTIDSICCNFGITLSKQIFTWNLRNISSIPWNMLRFKLISWATNPSCSLKWMISILKLFNFILFLGLTFSFEIISFFKCWFRSYSLNIVIWRFLFSSSEKFIDVPSSTSKDFILFWNVTCVARQIIFFVINEGFGRHF